MFMFMSLHTPPPCPCPGPFANCFFPPLALPSLNTAAALPALLSILLPPVRFPSVCRPSPPLSGERGLEPRRPAVVSGRSDRQSYLRLRSTHWHTIAMH